MHKTLVIGIGNPGPQYEDTFHNVGAHFVDWLATNHDVSWSQRSHARYATAHDTPGLVLGKTDTFMNESGRGVSELVEYLKLTAENIVIVHDDTDLELGKTKLVKGGGAAGHKGVLSITDALATPEFWRLKIGARPARFAGPPHIKAENFVLNRLGPEERQLLEATFDEAELLLKEVLSST